MSGSNFVSHPTAFAKHQTTASDPELELELQSFFPHATSSFDPHDVPVDVRSIHPEWKRQLYELLEQPNSSPSAFLIHVTITFLILLSAVVTILETIPYFHSTSPSVWFGIETSLVALFTIEYIARAVAWSSSRGLFLGWLFSFFGIIDLLAILPYYIELLLGVDTSVMFRFSILRTFRLLRVFRAFRTNNTIMLTIEVMFISVKRSQHALLALGFFLLMFLVIFSTILYFAERGSWDPVLETFIDSEGEPSQFSSIPAAAWFVLVTITTVGYGEITPRSFLGRLLTVPLLVCGLLLIALPSFVLGREFSIVWEMMGGKDGTSSNNDFDEMGTRRKSLGVDHAYEISRQIIDLQGALDAQGHMIRRLLEVVDRRDSESHRRVPNGSAKLWDSNESLASRGIEELGRSRSALGKEKDKGKERAVL